MCAKPKPKQQEQYTVAIPPPEMDPAIRSWSVEAMQDIRCVMDLENPRVRVYQNFLTEAECDAMVEDCRDRLRPNGVVDAATGEDVRHEARTSEGTFYDVGANDLIKKIEHRAHLLSGVPVHHCEGIQILRYGIGAEYKPHYDYFDPTTAGYSKILQRQGQRIVTLIFYLNTCPEGGETIFPKLGIKVAAVKGTAVLFHNTFPDGSLVTDSLHGGCPVVQGEKWIGTKWMRERPYTHVD